MNLDYVLLRDNQRLTSFEFCTTQFIEQVKSLTTIKTDELMINGATDTTEINRMNALQVNCCKAVAV